jgi:DNA-binding protein H-NS
MSTLSQIKKQIEELQQQAAEIQANEKESVLADIRQKIIDYGITPAELGLTTPRAPRKARAQATQRKGKARPAKPKTEAMYRGPDGQAWGGGRGRKPRWVQEILSSGGDLEKYRVRGKKSA